MGIFVGAGRQAIVDDLAARFAAIADGAGGVEVVVLTSPPGWGKTRIVQELYERLAAEQPEPRYWPPAIEDADGAGMAAVMHGRKRIYPRRVDVPAGASMPWMWWGVLCHSRESGEYAQAWSDDVTQVWAHADAIVNRASDKAGRAFDAAGALVGLVGLAGLAVAAPLGVVLTVGGAARTAWANKDLTARLEAWRQRRNDRSIDAAFADRGDRSIEMAEELEQIAREVPVILVVDDAHDADETLTGLIAHLVAAAPDARVLVVATAWPQALDAESHGRPFAGWLEVADPSKVTRVDLAPLDAADLEAIVIDDLIATDVPRPVEELASIATMVVGRVRGNTLGVRALVRLEEVQEALERGPLSEHDLAVLPGDLDAIFHSYWKRLPREVRQILERGAYLGTAYVPPVVVAAAIVDGIETAAEAAQRSADPYAWVRPLNDDLADLLHTFVDPLLHERARHEARRLTADQREHLHHQVVTAAVDAALAGDLPDQVRALLWQHHVTLARDGLADADDRAAGSAFELACRAADAYDYATAIALGLDALAWSDGAETLPLRSLLASWLQQAGRFDEAIEAFEAVLDDQREELGSEHPTILRTRSDLATCLGEVGRTHEAIAALGAVADDCVRILGADHVTTLQTRNNLAAWIGLAGRFDEAIPALEEIWADCIDVLGADHPIALSARFHLATTYGMAGRLDEAITAMEVLLVDCVDALGPDTPMTFQIRNALAMWTAHAGRTDDTTSALEGALDVQERALGPDHPTTLQTRVNLGITHWGADRTDDAIALLEAAVEDCVRVLGADNLLTLTARFPLAMSYWEAERVDDAVTALEALLVDQMRVVGTDHASTLQTRIALISLEVTEERIDVDDGIARLEAVLADGDGVLTDQHDSAVWCRELLALLREERDPSV